MKALFVISAVMLAQPIATLAMPIPDTGQTTCYDNEQVITCPRKGEDFYGQDARYSTNPPSYIKLDENGNELPDDAPWPWAMVRDNVTGLIWEMKTDDGSIHDKDDTYTWNDAETVFIPNLNNENFGGHSEWRLPTIQELSTIIDSGIPDPGPAINADYFPDTMPSCSYWSSTGSALNSSDAWNVIFLSGAVEFSLKAGFNYCVRAVRGGQSKNSFVDNEDGTVTDADTGLMWELKTDDGGPQDKDNQYAWQEALSYCEGLTLAGHNDWRLPDRNELQSIVDYKRYGPSIDPVFSHTAPTFHYWSSTTDAAGPEYAWGVHFFLGIVGTHNKSHSYFVRAVRDGQGGPLCPAAALYGEHSDETELLRYYRDYVLSQTHEGRELTRLYYLWSPVIVSAMKEDQEFKEWVKETIEDIIPLIEEILVSRRKQI